MFNKIIDELRSVLGVDFKLERFGDDRGVILIDSSVVRPKPLVLRISNNNVIIRNFLTFERSVRPKQVTRLIKNFIKLRTEGIHVSIIDNRRYLNLVFRLSDVVGKVSSLVTVLRDTLSEIPFLFPEYSQREYMRIGFQFGRKKLIIFDIKGANSKFLASELRFLRYPVLTLPDNEGKYFASTLGVDYLYFPLLSIVSEELDVYKVYKPVLQESGDINLEPWDFRRDLMELIKKLRQLANVDGLSVIERLIERPYLLKKYIGDLKRLLDSLESGRKSSLNLIYRSPGISSFTELGDVKNVELKDTLKGFREIVEYLTTIISMDNKLYDAILHRAIVDSLERSMLVAMYKVVEQKIRKLQKFGGGFALYLSAEEVEKYLGGFIYARIILGEDKNGKKKIIIEPVREGR